MGSPDRLLCERVSQREGFVPPRLPQRQGLHELPPDSWRA